MKTLVLLGSIALAACAVWLLTRADDLGASRTSVEAASPASAASPDPSAAHSIAQPASTAEDELPRASAIPRGPTFLALDAESGAPLANAHVLWCAESAWRGIPFALGQGDAALADDARTSPRWLATDTDGRVALPPCDERVHVRLYHGWLEGRETLAANDGDEHVVELRPTSDLLVNVVDAQGSPANDVQVSFRRGLTGEAYARTNADGLARLRDRRKWMSEHFVGLYMRVACEVPAGEPVALVLRMLPGPEPLELRLPPGGSFVVDGAAGSGGPNFAGVEAHIRLASSPARSGPLTARFKARVAKFPSVEPGSEWSVELIGRGLLDVTFPPAAVQLRGTGETVLDVSTATRAWIGVRLIDPDGRVLAMQNVQFDYARSADIENTRRGLPATTSTDADGRVWYTPVEGQDRWLVLWREGRTKSVFVDLSRQFPIGETLLPDVQLLAP